MNDVMKAGLRSSTEPIPEKMNSLKEVVEFYEKKYIRETLEQSGGKIQETATKLKIERTTLFKKMRKYQLK
jgi:DNA-binding NtrC family response regulator